jgi:hypothetical protein
MPGGTPKSQPAVVVPATGDPAPAQADPGLANAAPAPDEGTPLTPEQVEQAALIEASIHHPFGPAFFMTQLRGFAGEKCPDPALARPAVEIHLGDGEVLDLCHIIGVTPGWVALAVRDGEEDGTPARMRTEFVPYETIGRVTLRSSRPESPHLGFEMSRVPRVLNDRPKPEMAPEDAIRAAAAGPDEPRGD